MKVNKKVKKLIKEACENIPSGRSDEKIRRKEFLSTLKKLWDQHPHMRFFQLLVNKTRIGDNKNFMETDKGMYVRDPFYYQDDSIFEDMRRNIK